MKKFTTLVIAFFAVVSTGFSQLVYKDVASVFYSRCTSCHHTGASDFPLMNYAQTYDLINDIQNDLNINRMPPWSADTNYTRFQHERLITSTEKQLILNWIAGGALKGDTTQAPPAPTYPPFQLIGNADLTLSIGTFTSSSASTDKYFCFSIPSGLTQDRILRAYEVIPGNKKIVHHAVITADTTGNYNSDLSGSCYNIPGNLTIGTYAPGSKATIFPSQGALKSGIFIKAGSKIIIQIHYPAGSNGQVDSTKLRLFFYPVGTTGVRRIYTSTPLQNWNMSIPANSVVPYSAYYPTSGTLPIALSAFAVMPHSHLICKSILYYAVKPGVDTIPLVRVNNWDFEWQDYYTFRKLVKIPSGYRLYSKHIYDNTANNPNNPSTPPVNVYAGIATTDEMLFDGMMYLYYQPGDELIDLESIINSDPLTGIKNNDQQSDLVDCFAYPNPFSNSVSLRYILKTVCSVSVEITDLLGRKTGEYNLGKQTEGTHVWEWDGKNDKGDKVIPGIYFYKITAGDFTFKNKIIKRE